MCERTITWVFRKKPSFKEVKTCSIIFGLLDICFEVYLQYSLPLFQKGSFLLTNNTYLDVLCFRDFGACLSERTLMLAPGTNLLFFELLFPTPQPHNFLNGGTSLWLVIEKYRYLRTVSQALFSSHFLRFDFCPSLNVHSCFTCFPALMYLCFFLSIIFCLCFWNIAEVHTEGIQSRPAFSLFSAVPSHKIRPFSHAFIGNLSHVPIGVPPQLDCCVICSFSLHLLVWISWNSGVCGRGKSSNVLHGKGNGLQFVYW